jgi:aryl-alcohol dehydrogenase-like predicted oxidoreductase
MGLLPYFPLASGMLTGKYERHSMPKSARLSTTPRLAEKYMNEKNWVILEALRPFAYAKGRSVLDVAFSWLLSKPCVSSVIAGATSPDQVAQNVAAADWQLSSSELSDIDEILAME